EPATLLKPLVGWAGEPTCAEDVPRSLAEATFQARLRRSPSYLSVPHDDWDVRLDADATGVLDRSARRATDPDHDELTRLTEAFRVARNPALVLGGDIDSDG